MQCVAKRIRRRPNARSVNGNLSMCGIAGAFAFAPDAIGIDEPAVRTLTDMQRHRGPDGEGYWCSPDKRVAFGHRRLAIIDTSSRGAQPMWDRTGRWVITFNGEIYNYRALRSELESLGHRFLTNCDTEVLINVIVRWGEEGLRKLRGMFAFGLWDSEARELWLARDPHGIKPLYVGEANGALWFGSQARCLASCAPVDSRRDAAGVVGFHLWGYVPEPYSWWQGVRMFPAGHVQRIRFGKPLSRPAPYVDPTDAFAEHSPEPLRPDDLRELLLDSVRHHLVADVPVGLFLSAGVDSTVLAVLARDLGARLRTMTLGFDEFAGTINDEAPLAEATARELATEHVTVRTSRDEFEGLLDSFLRSMDQPTADGLNTYLVSRAASAQGLKVALSGLGGDELFGGYPSFKQIPRLLRFGRYKRINRAADPWLRALLDMPRPFRIPPKTKGLLSHSGDMASAYLLRRALYLEGELDALLDRAWLREGVAKLATAGSLSGIVDPLRSRGVSEHAQIATLEASWYMRNQLLRDTDWSSMAHGLEVRVPFVDATLFRAMAPAIASSRPPSKRDLATLKRPAREGERRRPKTGFITPVRTWMADLANVSGRDGRGWAQFVYRGFHASGHGLTAQEGSEAA